MIDLYFDYKLIESILQYYRSDQRSQAILTIA